MTKTLVLTAFLAFLLAAWPNPARAQGGFESVTGDALTNAVPDHFDLEKTHIPVKKENSALLTNSKGAQVVLALLITAGSTAPNSAEVLGALLVAEAALLEARLLLSSDEHLRGMAFNDCVFNCGILT